MKNVRLYPPTRKIKSRLTFETVVIPDQALTLQDIIRKFTRGEEIEGIARPAFYADGFEDLEKLALEDLTIIYENAVAARVKLEEEKRKADEDAAAAAKKAYDDEIERRVQERLKVSVPS